MAAISESANVAQGTISFELERFDRSDGRLELSGRWYGVRGMRFVRPTLTLAFGDGSSSRLLADLEHKPWAPEDGEPWQAAFPCADDVAALDAELAVAPGIAVPLPAPGEELPDSDPVPALPRTAPPRARRKKSDAAGRGSRPPQRSDVPDELAVLRDETQRLRQEPIRLRAELDRSEELRKHVESELERLKLDAGGAVARRDAAVDRFEDKVAERDEALQTRDAAVRAQNQAVQALGAAVRERDAARRGREEAERARDGTATERDRAIARLRESVTERDAAVAARDAALAERVDAAAERDKAVRERNAAVAERHGAVAERDAAVARCEQAIAERDKLRSGRATMMPATRAVAPVRNTAVAPILPEDQDQLIKRAVAIALLCVAGLTLLIILGVL